MIKFSIVTLSLSLTFITRKDNVRALLVLVQNPIFSAQSTYTVFAHTLQVHVLNFLALRVYFCRTAPSP